MVELVAYVVAPSHPSESDGGGESKLVVPGMILRTPPTLVAHCDVPGNLKLWIVGMARTTISGFLDS
jgi:hypothetical protein